VVMKEVLHMIPPGYTRKRKKKCMTNYSKKAN